jgi:hypothetical protein
MALASWFRLPKYPFASPLISSSRRSVRRQPLRSRLCLEMLEDRMLLSAASSNQFGGLNNPSVNFNTQSVGIVLPQQGTGASLNNGLAITQIANSLPLIPLGSQADPLAQSHLNDQFRAFAVNSQGQGNQAQWMQQQFFSFDAYGFGSGVQPNAPWKPATYNVGLANHQYDYASQSDNGFQSVPPWFHSFTQTTQQSQPHDEPLATDMPESSLIEHKMSDGQRTPQQVEQAAEGQKEKAKSWQEDRSSLQRGDPEVEKALFDGTAPTNDESTFRSSATNALQEATAEEGAIPSSLWLSAFAPAQIAALVVGLPAIEAPAASGEMVLAAQD